MRRRGEGRGLRAPARRPRWYDDAAALIADPEVDAVYVATPPGAHEELALAVCAAGKPGYVEKPMARNHAECRRMIEAFAAAGVPLFVAYYRRALPRFRARPRSGRGRRARRITGVSTRLSGPYHRDVVARVRGHAPALAPAGGARGRRAAPDLGCHTLDILDFICGPLEEVRGAPPTSARPAPSRTPWRSPSARAAARWAPRSGCSRRRARRRDRDQRRPRRAASVHLRQRARRAAPGRRRRSLRSPEPAPHPAADDPEHRRRAARPGHCASTGVSAARTSAIVDTVLLDYYGTRADGFWQAPESWPGNRVGAGAD